jgi:hypothetical protein
MMMVFKGGLGADFRSVVVDESEGGPVCWRVAVILYKPVRAPDYPWG